LDRTKYRSDDDEEEESIMLDRTKYRSDDEEKNNKIEPIDLVKEVMKKKKQ